MGADAVCLSVAPAVVGLHAHTDIIGHSSTVVGTGQLGNESGEVDDSSGFTELWKHQTGIGQSLTTVIGKLRKQIGATERLDILVVEVECKLHILGSLHCLVAYLGTHLLGLVIVEMAGFIKAFSGNLRLGQPLLRDNVREADALDHSAHRDAQDGSSLLHTTQLEGVFIVLLPLGIGYGSKLIIDSLACRRAALEIEIHCGACAEVGIVPVIDGTGYGGAAHTALNGILGKQSGGGIGVGKSE